jgi:hypothetical protein
MAFPTLLEVRRMTRFSLIARMLRVGGPVALGSSLCAGLLVASVGTASATATTATATFGYTGSTTTFTVPAGVSQLTLSMLGAEGGRGGADAAGPSPAGGYQGVVSGTMAVTPGQVLTIAVGQGGATGASNTHGSDTSNYTSGAAVGGTNPLGATYAGGNGGVAGWQGESGDGAGGGAATVITTDGDTIVAGGAGGAGGSGQFLPTLGRVDASSFTARTDIVSTVGQTGITVYTACMAPGSVSCDGGGSGAGGGGTVGGEQGQIQFGSATSDEWYGYGGSPGESLSGSLCKGRSVHLLTD